MMDEGSGVDGTWMLFVLLGDVVRDGRSWWTGGDEKRVLKEGDWLLGRVGRGYGLRTADWLGR